MKTRITLCWATTTVLLVASGCKEKAVETAPLVRSVRYVVVDGKDAASGREFSGVLQPGSQSKLAFQVPGRVQTINVKVGDRVKKGQVIATINPADLKLQLGEARAGAAQARAQATSAKATYNRVRALYEAQNSSRQDLDAARAQRDSASSASSSAYQTVERVKRQLAYATIRAPGDGTIVERKAEPNEIVGSGAVVAVLQVGDELEVAVDVPETAINDIAVGDGCTVDVESAEGKPLAASVYEVGIPMAGASVFPVTVRLATTPAGVRSGMAAKVMFKPSERPDDGSRVVPVSAVSEDREGRFVLVLDGVADGIGTVRRRNVEIGALSNEGIRIVSGVTDGEQVVTAGVARLTDGTEVRVPSKPGALR